MYGAIAGGVLALCSSLSAPPAARRRGEHLGDPDLLAALGVRPHPGLTLDIPSACGCRMRCRSRSGRWPRCGGGCGERNAIANGPGARRSQAGAELVEFALALPICCWSSAASSTSACCCSASRWSPTRRAKARASRSFPATRRRRRRRASRFVREGINNARAAPSTECPTVTLTPGSADRRSRRRRSTVTLGRPVPDPRPDRVARRGQRRIVRHRLP